MPVHVFAFAFSPCFCPGFIFPPLLNGGLSQQLVLNFSRVSLCYTVFLRSSWAEFTHLFAEVFLDCPLLIAPHSAITLLFLFDFQDTDLHLKLYSTCIYLTNYCRHLHLSMQTPCGLTDVLLPL